MNISAQDLKQKIDNDEIVVIDVLSKASYDQRHLPKALNVGLEKLNTEIPKRFPDKNQPIAVYCASTECPMSEQAYNMLKNIGYTNVFEFQEGLVGWSEAGFTFEGKFA